MNGNLLKVKMSEKGITQSKLASELGICENSLSRKIRGKREFRLSEAIAICEILEIKSPVDIFFDNGIPKKQQNGDRRGGTL